MMFLLRCMTLFLCVCLAVSANLQDGKILSLPDLPEPVSNNAVAWVNGPEGQYLVSMMGLGAGKTFQDVHNKVWVLKVGDDAWSARMPVPSSMPLKGRLASVAVGVKDDVFVFGGYTVAQDHTEISSPDNFKYDVLKDVYTKIAMTPVPVDDAIALVYDNRFIYLISGWHNDGNVNLVQVYDVQTDTWQQASPFLGRPVFGHAGGIIGHQIVVCDGVGVSVYPDKRRGFEPVSQCFMGQIAPEQHTKIDWRTLPHPTKIGRYRMAAGAINDQSIVFIGGASNPYNYNGIGYDTHPSTPVAQMWVYNIENKQWTVKATDQRTMDHRGIVVVNGKAWVIGGMGNQQNVLSNIHAY